jgi:hypothetical protein
MENNFPELDEKPTNKTKAIFDVKPEWPLWQRTLANIVNSLPVFLWAGITYLLLIKFEANPELAGYGDAYMNLLVRAVAYSILSLIAGVSLLSWLHPWFNPSRMMQGTEKQQQACVIYWGSALIALAIIIASIR